MFFDRKREMSNPGAPGIILLHLVALSKKKIPLIFPTISLENPSSFYSCPVAVSACPLQRAAMQRCAIQLSTPKENWGDGKQEPNPAEQRPSQGWRFNSLLHLAQLSPWR